MRGSAYALAAISKVRLAKPACVFLLSLIVGLGCTYPPTTIASPDPTCARVFARFKNVDAAETEGCVCDSRLSNLYAPLKHPFRVVAACSFQAGSSVREIDLGREKVYLDRFGDDGTFPNGWFYATGEMRLSGILKYEPGPAGEYWFEPDTNLLHGKPNREGQRPNLPTFKFNHAPPGLRIPTGLREGLCWHAKATLQVKGLHVIFWDNDSNGVWPDTYRLLDARDFKVPACP